MNKKQLYESILKDTAKIIKKHLNEELNNDDVKYLDENGLIDLSNLNILPKFIISNIVNTILKCCDYESNTNTKELTQDIFTIIDENQEDVNDIYLKSILYYDINLQFTAEYEIEYHKGYESYDYDVPDDPAYLEAKFITLYDVILWDGGDNEIQLSEELSNNVENVFKNTEFNENLMIDIADSNDVNDYDPINDEW